MSEKTSLLESDLEAFNYRQAGIILGLTRQAIAARVETGEIKAIRMWAKARPRITRREINRLLGYEDESNVA